MGRGVWFAVALVALLLLSALLVRQQPETSIRTVTITALETTTVLKTATLRQVDAVCFSRVQDCAGLIASLIDGASRSVHVMMYSFTSDEMADALIRAKNRGVEVKVVIENQTRDFRGSEYSRLLEAGIDVRVDGNPHLMHHKVVIIDGTIVVTGSYNWSQAAEKENDENLVVIADPSIAAEYEEEFRRIWSLASG